MADLSIAGLRAGPFPLKRILVLSDRSTAAENAAWRAGLLAREHGAWLRILHVRAWREDAEDAQRRLDALAWQLQERLRIAVVAQALRGGLRRELAAAATEADLLVTRAAIGGWPHDWLAGLHPDRLLQLCGLPTLVVRKAAAMPYQRVLAGIEPGPGVGSCIAAASGMAGGPHLALLSTLALGRELLHGDSGVENRARRVEARIHAMAEATPGARMTEAPRLVFAPTAAVLLEQEQALFPDLVVVPAVAGEARQWLAPSLPRRLVHRSRADLLVVPVPPAPATRGWNAPPDLGGYGAKVWPS